MARRMIKRTTVSTKIDEALYDTIERIRREVSKKEGLNISSIEASRILNHKYLGGKIARKKR